MKQVRASTAFAAMTGMLLAGCGPAGPTSDELAVTIALSDVIPTVATVTLEAAVDLDEAWIEFGPDTGYTYVAPVDLCTGSPYETLLLGMKPDSTWHARAVAVVDGEQRTGEDLTVTTGPVPASFTSTHVEALDPAAATGGFLVTSTFASPPAAVILDTDGDYVWWYESDEGHEISRALMTRDGSAMLYIGYVLGAPDQVLVRVSLDGAEVEAIPFEDAHHDFVELADGTIAALVVDRRDVDGETIEGDAIRELAPDGTVSDVYSVWQDAAYAPGEDDVPGAGWSHANALDHHEDDDSYTVSFLGLDSLFHVDRASGQRLWAMGGDDSDYALAGGSQRLFAQQHQFELLGDSILVFDNGTASDNESEALEYAIAGDEVELVWSWSPDPTLYNFSLGDVHRLPTGNTLVDFSVMGQFDEVTAEGELVWRLNLDMGGALGYVTWMESLYP